MYLGFSFQVLFAITSASTSIISAISGLESGHSSLETALWSLASGDKVAFGLYFVVQ